MTRKKPASRTTSNAATKSMQPSFRMASFDAAELTRIIPIRGITYEVTTLDKPVCVVGGGDLSRTSAGTTKGFAVRLPDDFEAAASGHKVDVSVSVRSEDGQPLDFAVAYSTAEVGNSGWRKFSATAATQAFSFEYDVAAMIKGNGDYIGILPDTEGTKRRLVVDELTVRVQT